MHPIEEHIKELWRSLTGGEVIAIEDVTVRYRQILNDDGDENVDHMSVNSAPLDFFMKKYTPNPPTKKQETMEPVLKQALRKASKDLDEAGFGSPPALQGPSETP